MGGEFMDKADGAIMSVYQPLIERLRTTTDITVIDAMPPQELFNQLPPHQTCVTTVEGATCHLDNYTANKEDYNKHITSSIEAGMKYSATDYCKSRMFQTSFRHELQQWLAALNVDAVLTPATPTTAPTPDTTGIPTFIGPWTFAGLPAICLPVGMVPPLSPETTDVDSDGSGKRSRQKMYEERDVGMPVNVQLVGHVDRERDLMAAAKTLERLASQQ
eukprot:GFYU01042611.1.p1 GENE.GFYU01042611.1~~GFYU01042611.1.p1  ORF type:complete len:233 (-),score=53.54 GFYU01042611.1:34-687(-)